MKKLNKKGMLLIYQAMIFMAVSVGIGEFGIHQGWFQRHQPTIDTAASPAPILPNLGGGGR